MHDGILSKPGNHDVISQFVAGFRVSAAILAALLLANHGAGVNAQPAARRPLSIVDLAELPRLIDPQLSPDGQSVVYMLNRPDWKANRPMGHLWRQSVSGGAPVQLTNGDAGESNARWSPDGRSILFLMRGRDVPETQIHLLASGGGAAKELTRHATSVSAARSEERRVGKECRSRWSPYH